MHCSDGIFTPLNGVKSLKNLELADNTIFEVHMFMLHLRMRKYGNCNTLQLEVTRRRASRYGFLIASASPDLLLAWHSLSLSPPGKRCHRTSPLLTKSGETMVAQPFGIVKINQSICQIAEKVGEITLSQYNAYCSQRVTWFIMELNSLDEIIMVAWFLCDTELIRQ